jgi:magnesium chelatase family protein
MLARVTTFAIDRVEPLRVWVEVDIRPGLPAFHVVGLADAAVREARERVRSALSNSGFDFPMRRITANLAPAHVRKVGPGFDLAIAIGVLAASSQVPVDSLGRFAVFGELSLGGEVRPVRGALVVAEGARRAGLDGLIVPRERAREAALVDGLAVAPVATLREVVEVLAGGEVPALDPAPAAPDPARAGPDLADVRGQGAAVAALVLAAAGGHNVFLQGPPGTGKTMLARRLPSILPPPTHDEALEITRIHSVAGLATGGGLVAQRPFRAPHHTISASGLVGGGSRPRPGEVTLAHRGVLFLDEMAEFARSSLDALRQPLEDGVTAIVRGQRSALFPARFMLVAASNPCPCGFAGSKHRECRCSESDLARHERRLSGPLLDRLDLVIFVERPSSAALTGPPTLTSAQARDQVVTARERQTRRLGGTRATCNADMDDRLIRTHARLTPGAWAALAAGYDRMRLSARGHRRAIRVARTVADLAGADRVEAEHMMTALGARQADQPREAAA